MSCINCGGTMVGDGYSSAIHCENTDPERYWYGAPDEEPFYCKHPEPELLYRTQIGECRLAFRSEGMWETLMYAIEDGSARITRFEGTLLEDGYTSVSVVVLQWPGGEVEKIKEDDFLDVQMM